MNTKLKTVVIGINNGDSNTADTIPPQIVVTSPSDSDGEDIRVITHFKPKMRSNGFTHVPNCDIWVDFHGNDDNETRIVREVMGNSYHLISRQSKLLTHQKIYNLKESGVDVHCMKVFAQCDTTARNTLSLYDIATEESSPDKVVIKRNWGANGKTQCLALSHQVMNIVHDMNKLTYHDLQEKYPLCVFTVPDWTNDPEEYANKVYCDDPSLIVTEYLDNIVEEYRVMVSGEECYGYQRFRLEADDYPQVDISSGGQYPDAITLKHFSELFPDQKSQDTVIKIIKALGVPYGSIDIYRLSDGRLGIFECSNEYGVTGMRPKDIYDIHRRFVEYLVNAHLN